MMMWITSNLQYKKNIELQDNIDLQVYKKSLTSLRMCNTYKRAKDDDLNPNKYISPQERMIYTSIYKADYNTFMHTVLNNIKDIPIF